MLRFFRFKKKINWTYIIGEILLLFISINLAIWFNNWNASKKVEKGKAIALERITEEIKSNKKELDATHERNESILNAFYDFQKIYHGNTSEILASADQLATLQQKHPNFFSVKDSLPQNDGQFLYRGTTKVELELPILTEIAWETTRATGLTAEFAYECLYNLESMYHLQRSVQAEIDKASNALQKRDLKELMHVLGFLLQLETQLQNDYSQVIESMDYCQ